VRRIKPKHDNSAKPDAMPAFAFDLDFAFALDFALDFDGSIMGLRSVRPGGSGPEPSEGGSG
jgi:hypothetical protein